MQLKSMSFDRLVDLFDDRGRRIRRRQQAEPADRLVVGHHVGNNRHVGIEFGALGVGDAERLQLAGLHQLLHHRPRREHDVDAATEQIGDRGLGAFIRHVQQLDAGRAGKQKPRQMRRRADSGRSSPAMSLMQSTCAPASDRPSAIRR